MYFGSVESMELSSNFWLGFCLTCVSIIIWVITGGVANFSLRGTTPVANGGAAPRSGRRGEAAFQAKDLLLR